MSTQTKFVIGGVVVGFLTFFIFPWWLSALIILGVIGAPVVGYLMLDPSQRKRVRAQGRKRLGS
jgi:energy-converting hydrogenase Eha subunit G